VLSKNTLNRSQCAVMKARIGLGNARRQRTKARCIQLTGGGSAPGGILFPLLMGIL
jgi:hypothetical protein